MSSKNTPNNDKASIAMEDIGTSSVEVLIIEKERKNESQYLEKYADLYRKHRHVMFQTPPGGPDDEDCKQDEIFSEERKILRSALQTQRNAYLIGLSVGVATFASLRFLPRYVIWRAGGETKLKAYREKLAKSRQHRFSMLQSAAGLMLEGSFSLWAGYRGYQMTLEQHSIYESLVDIPLCAGRSVVSDNMCDEWIDLTRRQIPPAFWINLNARGGLKDEETWKAIQRFSDNCLRRRAYEQVIRKERGIKENCLVALPKRVPDSST